MRRIVASGAFKRDLKRYKGKPETLKKLYEIVCMIERGRILPECYKMHMLTGKYKGYFECHIENDTLLIWFDNAGSLIKLIRLGSHSELFK